MIDSNSLVDADKVADVANRIINVVQLAQDDKLTEVEIAVAIAMALSKIINTEENLVAITNFTRRNMTLDQERRN